MLLLPFGYRDFFELHLSLHIALQKDKDIAL